MADNKRKAPGWFAGVILFVFSAGAGIAIAGSATDSGATIGMGVAILFGGSAILIVIANAASKRGSKSASDIDPFSLAPGERGDEEEALSRKFLDGRVSIETVGDVMEREDELISLLECGASDLADLYEKESEKFWDEYEGDDWDENVEAVNLLIDKYYKMYRDRYESEPPESAREDGETPEVRSDEQTAITAPTEISAAEIPPAREMPEAPPMPTYEPIAPVSSEPLPAVAPKVAARKAASLHVATYGHKPTAKRETAQPEPVPTVEPETTISEPATTVEPETAISEPATTVGDPSERAQKSTKSAAVGYKGIKKR